MARIYSIIVAVCWGLGIVSSLVAVGIKLVPAWGRMLNATPQGGLVLASTLFLCALATREMQEKTS